MSINVDKEQKRQKNLTSTQMFTSWGLSFPSLDEITNLSNIRHSYDNNFYFTYNPSIDNDRRPLNGWYKKSTFGANGYFTFTLRHFKNGYLSRPYNRPASSEYIETIDVDGDLRSIREYRYFNDKGILHNIRGPAVVTEYTISCKTIWYYNGKQYDIDDKEFYRWCRENGLEDVRNDNKNLSIEDETLIRMKWFS